MKVLFRTDVSATIGTGHFMRCLALAKAITKEGNSITFVSKNLPEAFVQKLASAGYQYEHDDSKLLPLAQNADWVVVDGYHFDASLQDAIKQTGTRLLWIDDYSHCNHYSADLILNQNIYANDEYYTERSAHTKLLLGTRFALLRDEFIKEYNRKITNKAEKIVITMGGGDPGNVTSKVLHSLKNYARTTTVVVGGANPFLNDITTECKQIGATLVIDTKDMRSLMEWADIAIAGGGTTSYELARMGLPTLTLVIAENQKAVADGMAAAGASINLGWHEDITEQEISEAVDRLCSHKDKREKMSQAASSLVDGKGALRVANIMRGKLVTLRAADINDMQLLFEWVNNPEVRASAFSTEKILQKEHKQWLTKKLADSNCYICIGIDEHGTPIGQIRFDVMDSKADIDVHLAPHAKGKGFGSALIEAGVTEIATHGVIEVNAYIKEENTASKKAFHNAGFTNLGKKTMHNCIVTHFQKTT